MKREDLQAGRAPLGMQNVCAPGLCDADGDAGARAASGINGESHSARFVLRQQSLKLQRRNRL